jgi:hypothetical protein
MGWTSAISKKALTNNLKRYWIPIRESLKFDWLLQV